MLFGPQTYRNIYLVDEHRAHLEEVQHEFHDQSKYIIRHFFSESKFLKEIREKKPRRGSINILILGTAGNGDHEKKLADIKNHIREVEEIGSPFEILILLASFDQKTENELLSLGAYAVVLKNENAFMRITNHIRGIISKKMLEKEKQYTRITLRVFFLFIIAVLLLSAVLILSFPERFSF
jgi:DNA-binding NarL/FixJ family response regulator